MMMDELVYLMERGEINIGWAGGRDVEGGMWLGG